MSENTRTAERMTRNMDAIKEEQARNNAQPVGEISPELAAWLERQHDPRWKFKPATIRKPSKPRGAGKDRDFADLVREFKYAVTETVDLRELRAPVASLAEFIARKSKPGWKPAPVKFGRISARKMTAGQVRTETQRIAHYVQSYNRQKAAAA